MSGYMVCPTCNRLLADKIIPYEEGIRRINNEKNATEDDKMKLLDDLKIPRNRYCCRMRLMTYSNLINIVK